MSSADILCRSCSSWLLAEELGRVWGFMVSTVLIVADLLVHAGTLSHCRDTADNWDLGFLGSRVCILVSLLSQRWPVSNPVLIFCFPVNSKIDLNYKLGIDLLLFLALKEEVRAHFGCLLLFLFTFSRWP